MRSIIVEAMVRSPNTSPTGELTGSYGAGLTRFLHQAGITVLEVNTTDKATRARRGKDDRTDAFAAAHKVLAGMATRTRKTPPGSLNPSGS